MQKLSDKAILPTVLSNDEFGFYLCSAEEKIIKGYDEVLINTDLAIQIPHGCYGQITSQYLKNLSLSVRETVIYPQFQGNIQVLIQNNAQKKFVVQEGERIALFRIKKIVRAVIQEVDKLPNRNAGMNVVAEANLSELFQFHFGLSKPLCGCHGLSPLM